MNIVAAIYFHPEQFPPTLNAVGELSQIFNHVYLLHRPHLKGNWVFGDNVKMIPSGKYITTKDQEQSGLFNKIGVFFSFTRRLYIVIKRNRPKVVLLYDSIPLFSYYLIRNLLMYKPIIWYHNHDVTEKRRLRKYSISWFAASCEKRMFPKLGIFSLPAEERMDYFPMTILGGKSFFIPNFPARKFYDEFKYICKPENSIKILFQGSIGLSHGIEEIMGLLPKSINGKPIQLVLKGFMKEPFSLKMDKIIRERSIQENVELHGVTSYKEVPLVTASCHIGIAIFAKDDIMNKTLGTASNKIYEYAACGLPVLYYDNEHFKNHLSKYKWAIPTDLSNKSLMDSIELIDSNYQELSEAARADFENDLNFEKKFKVLAQALTECLD